MFEYAYMTNDPIQIIAPIKSVLINSVGKMSGFTELYNDDFHRIDSNWPMMLEFA
jgi:hypothetical protein